MKSHILLATAFLGFAALPDLNASVTITRHPTNHWVSLGAHVTNRVTASSTAPPITYQWYGKGALLSDQTNSTLILNKIQPDQAGEYYVVVNDADNQPVQSDTATLTVDPTFIKITEGPVVTERADTEDARWWDPDGDAWLDLFVNHMTGVNSSALPSFFQNNRDGTFTKITTNALAQAPKRGVVSAVGDFDNDGDEDMYYLGNAHAGSTEPRCDLFRNDSNGRFTAAPGPWQQDLDLTIDCTFVDYDQDGLLDIYVVNGHKQTPCLYRQTVHGGYTKMTAAQVGSILVSPPESWNAAWADFDNDGDLDLFVENGEGPNHLHRNDGRGFFTRITEGSIVQSVTGGLGFWGDYDNDGWLDLFTGGNGFGGSYVNALHRNLQGAGFTNVAASAGIARQMGCWGAAWGDYDNDGWLDLFASAWPYTTTKDLNILFHNRGDGTFESVDVGSPMRDGWNNETVLWADYDNDGFLDLFLGCGGGGGSELNYLYRNNLPGIDNTNRWLKIKLNGQASNRSGIGAKIRVMATIAGKEIWQAREITGNGASASGPGLVAHFGLGDATKVDLVRVEWPSGNVQELTDVPAGQIGHAPRTITEEVLITPTRPSASLGGSGTLTSQRGGATAWQWYHDGVALEGETDQTLALSGIAADDPGRYSVVVTTATGMVTNFVYLLVDTQFERVEMGDETPSWGCAWGDYNNDDYPDLFVGEGTFASTAACSLYRNNKDSTFLKATPEEAGDIVAQLGYWQSPAWGDYDGDGWLDLFLTENPPTGPAHSVLWRNLGNGQFEDATSFPVDDLYGNPIWGDYNADGRLDLFVASAWYKPPTWDVHNALYLNDRDGGFTRLTGDELFSYRGQLQGGSAADMDGDGDLDILLTGNTGIALFENDGTGRFRRLTSGLPTISGMSITPSWADYDNDGRLDVFVAVYSSTSALLHNDGDGQWTKIALGPGLETSCGMWADYDNDGDLDLFITRGQGTTTTNLLYANNGDGTFTQVTLGSLPNDPGLWAGSAWADYDNNGFQDLFVSSHAGREVLYRNQGNGNHWISFKLVGTASNRSAIGAKVRVFATISGKTYWQMREIGGGNRHQNDLRPHFGLGNATGATTVRIEWPSGTVQQLSNVTADQVLTVWEPPFLRAAMQPNGSCELSITAEPNRSWQIQASTDLSDWQVLTTVTNTAATFRYTDTASSGLDCRFYRVASE